MLSRRVRVVSVSVIAALAVALGGMSVVADSAVTPDKGPDTGGTQVRVLPPPDGPAAQVAAVGAGGSGSLAITANGTTYFWGSPGFGGVDDIVRDPAQVQTPVEFTEVSAGYDFRLAQGADGNTYAWGLGKYGVLGNGTTANKSIPEQVLAPADVAFTQISAGLEHSLALGDNGKVYAWGRNTYGQLGNGNTAHQPVPVEVRMPTGAAITSLSAGWDYSLATTADGHLYAWGDLYVLGEDEYSIPTELQMPDGVVFASISAGSSHAIALAEDGAVYSFGDNYDGQLGNGGFVSSLLPVPALIPSEVEIAQVSAGGGFSLARSVSGDIYAWGKSISGELGIGTNDNCAGLHDDYSCTVPTPISNPAGTKFVDVSAGSGHSLAVGIDGTTYAWGIGVFGELGPESNLSREPVRVPVGGPRATPVITGVAFDGIPGQIVGVSPGGTLNALTPARWAGTVDVAVEYRLRGVQQPPYVYKDAFTYTNTHGEAQATAVTISGKAAAGQTLTATGTYANGSPGKVTESYTWSIGGQVIGDRSSLDVTRAMSGKTVTVTYTVVDEVTDTESSKQASVVVSTTVLPPEVTRVYGENRYATNYELNKNVLNTGMPVFVATGGAFPDALSIGPAVSLNGGALVLTPRGSVRPEMLTLLGERVPSDIYVIGGKNAVSENVLAQLQSATGVTPKRISGSDRYATSASVFKEFFSERDVDLAFVATGTGFPDALSASAAGGALAAPVLLVNGRSAKNLDSELLLLLRQKGTDSLRIVGGAGAVNSNIANALGAQFEVERLSGSTRYDTNLAVNNFVQHQTGTISATGIWVATGRNFPDALSAGAPAGFVDQRLVLSNGSCIMKPVVSQWIKGIGSQVERVTLVGGKVSLGQSVFNLTECR